MNNNLIYGKGSTQRIVSIEVDENLTEIFTQDESGKINSQFVNNKYWILSNKPHDSKWIKLKGNLFYQFGKQFDSREEYFKAKNSLYGQDIFTIFDPKESFMVNKGETYFKGMKHGEVSVLSFDIESTSLEQNHNAKILLIANTLRKNNEIKRKMFCYDEYPSQGAMLVAWCKWICEEDPSIIISHNGFTYDLPYIKYIADQENVQLIIGRNGTPIKFDNYESKFRKDGSQFYHYKKARVYGRELIDTMFLAVKYDTGRKYESYALKQIIKQEGLEVENRVFYDASQIRHTYRNPVEWAKIKKYAEHDGDDALALYDLMSPSFFYMTQSIPKSFQSVLESASGSQINSIMIRAYLQQAHSLPKASSTQEFEGGISLGNPGIYRNVFKVDVASLYPNIMLQYEVCDSVKDPNKYFLEFVQTFTTQRLHHKKLAKETGDKYYDDLQNAEKIFINSAYGFLGAQGLLFNSPHNAAFVTSRGREILQTSIDWAKNKNFTIVNADTDSIAFCQENYRDFSKDDLIFLLEELNSLFPEKIKFENDGYFKTVIVFRAKNYILFDGQKIKYKGSAIKATTKEAALKQFIKDIIDIIIEDKRSYTEIYNSYVKEIMHIEDMRKWSCKKTITDKVLNPERTNERKVNDAIQGSEYVEGDKAYFYFKSDNSLDLVENFDGDYSKEKLLEKLYKTTLIFEDVLPVKDLFINYKLKKNKKLLEQFN